MWDPLVELWQPTKACRGCRGCDPISRRGRRVRKSLTQHQGSGREVSSPGSLERALTVTLPWCPRLRKVRAGDVRALSGMCVSSALSDQKGLLTHSWLRDP